MISVPTFCLIGHSRPCFKLFQFLQSPEGLKAWRNDRDISLISSFVGREIEYIKVQNGVVVSQPGQIGINPRLVYAESELKLGSDKLVIVNENDNHFRAVINKSRPMAQDELQWELVQLTTGADDFT